MENRNLTQTTDVVPSRVPRLPRCIQNDISGKEQDVIGVKSYVFMQAS